MIWSIKAAYPVSQPDFHLVTAILWWHTLFQSRYLNDPICQGRARVRLYSPMTVLSQYSLYRTLHDPFEENYPRHRQITPNQRYSRRLNTVLNANLSVWNLQKGNRGGTKHPRANVQIISYDQQLTIIYAWHVSFCTLPLSIDFVIY